MVDFLQLFLFEVLCVAVIFFDLFFRRVPNWLMLFACCLKGLFLLENSGLGFFSNDWKVSVFGLFAGLFIFVPFYAFRAMGAGDVKFFAVVGFWLGTTALLVVFLFGSLLAGLHAVCYVLFHGSGDIAVLLNVWSDRWNLWLTRFAWFRQAKKYVAGKRKNRVGIPYAAYLAVAAIGLVMWRN